MKPLVIFAAAGLLLSRIAVADICRINISADDQMRFDQKVLRIDSGCTEVEVSFANMGKQSAKVMGHNWVLTRTRDVAPVAVAGMGAGFVNNYQTPGDSRIIAATKVIGGGETASVKFSVSSLKSGEDYSFFCSAPGHYSMMKGRFEISAASSVARTQT